MMNKYGIQIEIKSFQERWHWRVFTTEDDWSGLRSTLEEALEAAKTCCEKMMNE